MKVSGLIWDDILSHLFVSFEFNNEIINHLEYNKKKSKGKFLK